jgi:hypothetical protein
MENKKYIVWGAIFILVPIILYALSPKPETKVLSETISVTPTPTPLDSGQAETPTIVETPVPTATPSATLTPTPTKVPRPSPAPSQEVNGTIDRFSAQYGVDPNVMRHLAICESGFNSSAVQGAYVGLYQFGAITWKNLRTEIGEDADPALRFSAEESVQTAAYALSVGKQGIWPNCQP